MPSKSVNCEPTTINQRQRRFGFTLIELLVVITIIGILATFIVASFTSAQKKGRDARRKSDLDAMKKALELAKSDSTGAAYYPAAANTASLETPGYIKKIPLDPSDNVTAYLYTPAPALCTTACTTYTLVACLENANDPQKDTTDICGAAGAPVSYTQTQP